MTAIRITSYDENDRYSKACLNSIRKNYPNLEQLFLYDGDIDVDVNTHIVEIPSMSLVIRPLEYGGIVPLSELIGNEWQDISVIDYSECPLDSLEFLLKPKYRNISLELYHYFKEYVHG